MYKLKHTDVILTDCSDGHPPIQDPSAIPQFSPTLLQKSEAGWIQVILSYHLPEPLSPEYKFTLKLCWNTYTMKGRQGPAFSPELLDSCLKTNKQKMILTKQQFAQGE